MKDYKLLPYLIIIYVVFQLIADVTAGKITHIGPFIVSVTVLYFPVTYIISDILTEVYGYAIARRTAWIVLISSIVAGLIYMLVVALPAWPGFMNNDAYSTVLWQVPRILIGWWIAVWAWAILNDIVLAKMKVRTKGKYLWMRTIWSTVIGEGANTAIFYAIGLYGILPDNILTTSILSAWLLKVLLETVLTPLTYFIINKVKKIEHEDHYDRHTNFNPLKI